MNARAPYFSMIMFKNTLTKIEGNEGTLSPVLKSRIPVALIV